MSLFELRQLHSFVVLADTLHFRRAAEQLYISQPALSRQMQHLEEHLGIALFDRSGRSVQLTAAGDAFLREAHKTLQQAEQAQQTAQRVARGEQGTLVIGFTGPAIYGVLADIVRAYRGTYPDVNVVLREMQTRPQLDALRQGSIDLGVHEASGRCDALQHVVIELDELIVALPPDHPLATLPAFDLVELAEEPMVLFDRTFEPKLHDGLLHLCEERGFTPVVSQHAERLPIIVGLVRAGLGWAFATTTIRDGLGACGLVFKPVRPSPEPLERRLAWTHTSNPTRDRFVALAREVIPHHAAEVLVG